MVNLQETPAQAELGRGALESTDKRSAESPASVTLVPPLGENDCAARLP